MTGLFGAGMTGLFGAGMTGLFGAGVARLFGRGGEVLLRGGDGGEVREAGAASLGARTLRLRNAEGFEPARRRYRDFD